MGDLKGCKKCLANNATSSKMKNLLNSGKVDHWFWDKIIFGKTKDILGGRCRYMCNNINKYNIIFIIYTAE